MSTRRMWMLFAVVIVPAIILVGAFQDEPLGFIVIFGLLMFFVTGAGIQLGELREIARERGARERRRAMEHDVALDRVQLQPERSSEKRCTCVRTRMCRETVRHRPSVDRPSDG